MLVLYVTQYIIYNHIAADWSGSRVQSEAYLRGGGALSHALMVRQIKFGQRAITKFSTLLNFGFSEKQS